MKVVLSTVGRFHFFALARELQRQKCLARIYSGFPWAVLRREQVDRNLVSTFPFIRPALMGLRFLPIGASPNIQAGLDKASVICQDLYVSSVLPECDIFVGHGASGRLSGRTAKKRGAKVVSDIGTSHFAWRDDILGIEYERAKIKRPLARSPVLEWELESYSEADLIVVPSSYSRDTFVAKGLAPEKLEIVPYGVRLDLFFPTTHPSPEKFEILFVGGFSVGKGAFDLLNAFRMAKIPNARLTLIGTVSQDIKTRFSSELSNTGIRILGHVPNDQLKYLMSASHVLILPSVDEGFGMVLAEAMACGCPVIATTHSGARDLYSDGIEGYIVPIRQPEIIADRLRYLFENPEAHEAMREAAIARVQSMGGWAQYGRLMTQVYGKLLGNDGYAATGLAVQ